MSASSFLSRLPDTATEEREIVSTAFRIVDTLNDKANEIRGNQHLTKIGQDEQIKMAAKGGIAEHFRQLQARASKMASDAANLRQGFKLKAPDKADLFGELQRQEIRTLLRNMPETQRIRAALEDPTFADAIVHAAPALSGLSADMHGRVKDAAIERVHGLQLRGIAAREETIEVVNSALAVAAMQYRNASGLKEGEF